MIVFSDMDGTLLTSDKQMSDATWAMLYELARRGIEFVPCTGRPLSGVFEPILAHPAVHYAVCANGASVWQLDDGMPTDTSRATRILSRPLDRAIAHRVHSIAAGHDVTFDIFADGQCFLPRSLYTRLCEHLGERLADAWAFGDNINDIPMLQAAGHGMAMINGEPEDREAADAITEYDNDHDGVARAIMTALA